MGDLDLGHGAKVYWHLLLFDGKIDIPITQTMISLLAVTVFLITVSFFISKNLKKRPGRFQVLVEKGIGIFSDLVESTMGKHNMKYAPYILTLFLSSVCGSLIGTLQIFRSTTADVMVTMGWALVTTGLCWYESIKSNGFFGWLKGYTEPVVVMTPMNIIGEIAQPVSMAFRHFGNVTAGNILMGLVYAALAGVTHLLFSWLPERILACIPPIFDIGIPAFLSIYFDFFSGFVQAFVFSLLTMIYVGAASPPPVTPAEEKPLPAEN